MGSEGSSARAAVTAPLTGARQTPRRPRIVVVGAGFGGLEAARRLARLPVEVTLIDRHNYHTFTPLLYQVATAGLEPEQIAHPVRAILRGARNVRFRVADVRSVDTGQRQVSTDDGDVPYDYLVVACGSTNNFFGNASLAAGAMGLKDLDEALALRNHILGRFEAAAWEKDPDRRSALLTFVVVGGGPTGVEFAGALRELVSHVLPHDFPGLDFGAARVILIEAADRVLAPFAPRLRSHALQQLHRRGVEVRLNTAVERITGDVLELADGETILSATVMWAAGVRAGDLAASLPAERASGGRVRVSPTLQLPGYPEVFVIGDMAAVEQHGEALPMIAPVAIQQARCVAANIACMLDERPPLPFAYHDRGIMATIGRNAAVAQIGRLKLSGFPAWVMWLALHIVTLVGFRNRVFVLMNWIWNYFSYDRAVRIILGDVRHDRGRPD